MVLMRFSMKVEMFMHHLPMQMGMLMHQIGRKQQLIVGENAL